MASQLRLHVLLPIAILGALGAAVGAFMVGNKPPDGDAGVPLITTHPDNQPTPTGDAWAAKANAWCADVNSRIKALGGFDSPEEFESDLGEYVQIVDSAEPAFIDLGWPKAQKKAVLAVRRNLKQTVALLRAGFNHVEKLDVDWLKSKIAEAEALDESRNRLFSDLGAETCAKPPAHGKSADVIKAVAVKPASDLIRAQLERYPKVVVLFYKPDASYDAIQTREARAGALAARAGFVAVDVTKNREVAQLAQGYDVLQSPTVLIFVRPLRLKARIEGLYDRTAIMQAVRNA